MTAGLPFRRPGRQRVREALAQGPESEAAAEGRRAGTAQTILSQPVHHKIRALVDYWCSIAPEGDLPGRQHFDPAAIPLLLPNLWLVDVEHAPRRRYRYRLIGTHVARAFAGDSTGRYLDEAHPGFFSGAADVYLDEVVSGRQPSWRKGRPVFWQLQNFLSLERIYLPLARDGREVDMILALTVFFGTDGREY